jgi:hypothetical protein
MRHTIANNLASRVGTLTFDFLLKKGVVKVIKALLAIFGENP